jgi:vitamin B12/bleomycin/antimicrobial peptide transport system ATP-binding/permease protein
MRDVLKQIWRFLRIAATGPGKWLSLLLLLFVIGCQYAVIQVNVRQIHWYADFYNALQKLDVPVIISQIWVFFLLAGISAGLYLVGRYARKILLIRWRRRLTDTVVESWTAHKAHWLLSPVLAGERSIDNPDQRVAEDCNMFCEFILGRDEGARSGVLDFVMNTVGLYTYASLLWQLATFTLSLSALGFDVEIPKYMFWLAPLYVAVAITITHTLGRPLSGLLAEEQKREADFRSALIHVRENTASVAMLDGEAAERRLLSKRFDEVAGIWYQVIRREFIFGLFQRPYFQTVLRIPIFIALPAFLAGKVTLGGLMQLANAFSQTVTTMSWFVFNYKFLSDLVATTRRMQRFLDAVQTAPETPAGPVRRFADVNADMRIADLAVHTPNGRTLVTIDDLIIKRGQTVWLRGASGLGKSTLFKAFAGMWPHASGTIELPAARISFLPQQVYLPLDTLAAAAIYPALPGTLAQSDIDTLLQKVGLGHRIGIDEAIGLSVGEQQRLALARVLAAKPDWVFLDEATSALDLESECKLMTLLRTELPDATFVIVAHREPQGLTDVVRIELSKPPTNNVTLARDNPVQTNLVARMG